jgi:hypothetical protein
MKRTGLVCALVVMAFAGGTLVQAQGGGAAGGIFAPPAAPTGPLVDVVNSIVTAFNNRDAAFFQKMVAPDTVWFDEDGHALRGTVWVTRLLGANPPRKISISNLRVGNWDTAGWAGFNYVMEGSPTGPVKGVNTFVFKKNGNDWQIVNIHGALDSKVGAH